MPVMPDSRIPLGAVADQPQSDGFGGGMLRTLGSLMKIKEEHEVHKQRQFQVQQQQRALEDDDAIRTTLQQYGTPDEAITDLYKQGRAGAAAKLGSTIFDSRKKQLEAYDAQVTSQQKRIDMAAQLLQGIKKGDSATYKAIRASVLALVQPIYGDSVNDMLPTEYDEDRLNAIIAAGTKRSEQMTKEHNGVQELVAAADKGLIANPYGQGGPLEEPGVDAGSKWSKAALEIQDHYLKAASMVLPDAPDKAAWDARIGQLQATGASPQTLAMIPKWDDANPEAARKAAANLGLTQKDRADVADREATRLQTGQHQKETERTGRISAQAALTRAQTAAAGGGTGTGAPRAITPNTISQMKEDRNKRVEKLDDVYRTGGSDGTGRVEPGEEEDEYLSRRVQYYEDYRDTAEGKPPFKEAAQQAVDAGDRTTYDKVAKEYATATKGRRTLESLVPWKANPKTPPDRKAAIGALNLEFKTATPARQAAIQSEIRRLQQPQ